MAEEVKINPIKAFFADPVKLISVSLTIGSLLFAWGVTSGKKDVKTGNIEVKVDDLAKKVDKVITTQEGFSTVLNSQITTTQKQNVDFEALETSHVNMLTIINRMDEVIKYYENKAALEKKKN
jgi:hypothetical protein